MELTVAEIKKRLSDEDKVMIMPATTSAPDRICFREITGRTFNALNDCVEVLRLISTSMEGDADTPRCAPEVKCFRDALMANFDLSQYILMKLNQIAEDIGV